MKLKPKDWSLIFTCLGEVGLFLTAYTAKKDTLKYEKIMRKKRLMEGKVTKKEKVKVTALCYAPTAAVIAASSCFIFGSYKIGALAGAITLKAAKQRQEYDDEKNKNKDISYDKRILNTLNSVTEESSLNKYGGDGKEELCTFIEKYTKRSFKAYLSDIQEAIDDAESRYQRDEYVALNDLYHDIGIEYSDIGDEGGWSAEYARRFLGEPDNPEDLDERKHIGLSIEPIILSNGEKVKNAYYINYGFTPIIGYMYY